MSLSEYLYVDENRLNSYIEQIGSPFKYDKVPIYKAEIGLTGPKLSREQQSFKRSLTTQEKINLLLDYLSSTKYIHKSRNGALRSSFKKDFVLEVCDLTRFVIPPKKDSSQAIVAWILREPKDNPYAVTFKGKKYHYELLLLEDINTSDIKSNAPHITKFSAIMALLIDHSDRLKKTILSDLTKFPLKGFGLRYVSLMVNGGKLSPYEQAIISYSTDPIKTLESLGCKIGIPRKVRVLYRVRYFDINKLVRLSGEYSDNVLSVFGYPIYIIDA